MNRAASQFIDAVRWMAAALVVLHHATNIFVNLSDIILGSVATEVRHRTTIPVLLAHRVPQHPERNQKTIAISER